MALTPSTLKWNLRGKTQSYWEKRLRNVLQRMGTYLFQLSHKRIIIILWDIPSHLASLHWFSKAHFKNYVFSEPSPTPLKAITCFRSPCSPQCMDHIHYSTEFFEVNLSYSFWYHQCLGGRQVLNKSMMDEWMWMMAYADWAGGNIKTL